MSTTVVTIERGSGRATIDLRAGILVPRLIERTATTARIALVAGGALLLGGDEVGIEIGVGEGCLLELQEIGGTVAYSADGRRSCWRARVAVGSGGALLWNGQPLIVADGADVLRSTAIALDPAAVACLRETVVLGRHGERGGTISVRSDVRYGGHPLLIEELTASGDSPETGVLGTARVYDTIGMYGLRAPPEPGVLQLEGPGSLLRFLGAQAHFSTLDSRWASWKGSVIRCPS